MTDMTNQTGATTDVNVAASSPHFPEPNRHPTSSQLDRQPDESPLSSLDVAPNGEDVLILCGQDLEKLARAAPEHVLNTTTLLLDDNRLQRLDNIHTYQCLEKLSAQNNRISRMLQVSKLQHLKILNLAGNKVQNLEGLRDLKLLTWLSLAANQIKSVEPLLTQNVHLEHLDLSANRISHLSDLSYLKHLKVLLLHKNQIVTLKSCERFLPHPSLNALTLNDNQLQDLAELCHLSHLAVLEQLTIANNPACRQPEVKAKQFDYRPFVINWCLNIRLLDGVAVEPKESLKAEWMYSQSKGRHFAVGQQTELLDYLVQTCPLHPDGEWQEDKKLNLILSKVQEHQSSLRDSSTPVDGVTAVDPSAAKVPLPVPGRALANSSVATTPASTPSIPRRSSMGSSHHGGQPTIFLRKRSSGSTASPSSLRRACPATPTNRNSIREQRSYNVALPRTLYGDDVNGNSPDTMSRSCLVEANGLSQVDSSIANLMATSLDPAMFVAPDTAWAFASRRPNRLLSEDEVSDGTLRDVSLQDLSEAEGNQSMMLSKLQTRLNPVPESLNGPDLHPPPSSEHLVPDESLKPCGNGVMPPKKVDPSSSSDENQPAKGNFDLQVVRNNNVKNARRTDKNTAKSRPSSATAAQSVYSASSRGPTPRKQTNDLKKPQTPELARRSKLTTLRSRFEADADGGESETRSESSISSLSNRAKRNSRSAAAKRIAEDRKDVPTTGVGPSRKKAPKKSPRPASSAEFDYAPERYSERERTTSRAETATKQRLTNGTKRLAPQPTRSSKCPNVFSAEATTLSHGAATTIQKRWKGHNARNNDKKVQELKEEVREMRTDQHVRHLTKELAAAKVSLEKERKLRTLQMDAMKILWKEVQMIDPSRVSRETNNSRPSGSSRSKISSRSSECSIAKLMETLEATAGPGKNQSGLTSTPQPHNRDGDTMTNGQNTEAIESLNKTCASLQSQIEQLQSSLAGVMRFMSAFSSLDGIDEGFRCGSFTPSPRDTTSLHHVGDHRVSSSHSSGPSSMPHQSKQLDVGNSDSVKTLFQQPASRESLETFPTKSKSPKTLPGLKSDDGSNSKAPGLAQLAGTALLNSPDAPSHVKTFAKTLVEGLIGDAVLTSKPSYRGNNASPPLTVKGQEMPKTELDRNHELGCTPDSSHVDTDSLEDNYNNDSK